MEGKGAQFSYVFCASEKKESSSEGMAALLSVYGGDGEEMEDPLDKFLTPPPKAKCSEELQEKIIKFLALKSTTGRRFNEDVRKRKEYCNPDFMRNVVLYQNIDEIGSSFGKNVFDPRGYDECDFYDEIEADMSRETERREQEMKKTPKFVLAAPKIISMPTPGSTGFRARDRRRNKKSKWDMVDVDQRKFI
ncbi:PREDICTED: SAP30-binding protein-like [Erythranthe guttata]|uniref:SAP30-binding protein-like n=1 Tax=Erythranthe guttata TaxID=4155 RepID=UPI00064DB844|nr:PREDICTED: SAP30-binding protein-like [Erythranthe guttata]|eukprot:XP_012850611.1 PREDICTED: SAP30-binding protein-like [Erythranthe guttata]